MDETVQASRFRWRQWGTAAAIVALVAGAFGFGLYIGADNSDGQLGNANTALAGDTAAPPEDVDFDPLWQAWDLIDERYVPTSATSTVSDQEKLWGTIQGLAGSLNDPYTKFLPPQDNEVFKENVSGRFGGVGMEIGIRDEVLTVISPLEGTPAQSVGLQSGDKIIAINGTSTQDMGVDRAVKLIRGEVGTDVTLTIRRDGAEQALEKAVTRERIQIPTIETTQRSDGVYVIKLHSFNATAPEKFRDALREVVEADADKLVIDLRGNPGGFLQAAIDVSSWFLPRGKVVVREDFGEKRDARIHRSKGYDVVDDDVDIVVLVNRGSASASEIVAGALQDHDVATVVGEQTFGKGSVQELVDIGGKSSLKVTIARWETPDGRQISQKGIMPDIRVGRTVQDVRSGRDPQLNRAIELLTGERVGTSTAPEATSGR
jgi:carboxyl-terminal processing protease